MYPKMMTRIKMKSISKSVKSFVIQPTRISQVSPVLVRVKLDLVLPLDVRMQMYCCMTRRSSSRDLEGGGGEVSRGLNLKT